MWIIFKIFIEFVTILFLFYGFFFFWPQGMSDLSSLARNQTRISCIGRCSPNHWTAREALTFVIFYLIEKIFNLVFISFFTIEAKSISNFTFYYHGGNSVVKNTPANVEDTGDVGSIPGWERSPGGGNGNPLQYSCLENPVDRGAWRATVQGVTKSQK